MMRRIPPAGKVTANHKVAEPGPQEIQQLIGLFNAQRLQDAETRARQLIQNYPNALILFDILGAALTKQGKLEEAAASCRHALKVRPDYFVAHNNLGNVLKAQGKLDEAAASYRKALKINPNYAEAHSNLGIALRELGRFKEAIPSYQQAIRIKPDFVEAHNNLATAFLAHGDIDEAVASCRRALKIKPDHSEVLHNLGSALMEAGRPDDALSAFEAGLAHQASPSIRKLYKLSQLPASLIDADILSMIDEAKPEPNVSKEEFESLRAAARAAELDKAGRHAEAWENLVIANRLPFRQKQNEYLRDRQQREASLAWLRNAPAAEIPDDVYGHTLSLHILGPSRSGKTTLENLAAALDGTRRGFESSVVQDAWHQAFDALDLPRNTPAIDISPAVEALFREHYFKELEKRVGSARIFTNTAPGSIEMVSHMVATLPNSRFIFLQRDASDICLRIYMKIYNWENAYTYDIENILEYVTWYNEMIGILAERFPQISKVIRYEDMIADPAATLRSVAELCGTVVPQDVDLPRLGDDRGCAEPYKAFIHTEL